jgi:hypothetical protein
VFDGEKGSSDIDSIDGIPFLCVDFPDRWMAALVCNASIGNEDLDWAKLAAGLCKCLRNG